MFSFFPKVLGGGGHIRATQVSEYIGGRINPKDGYENDVCIYVLGERPSGKEPKYSYYDVMDCPSSYISRLRRNTRGAVISNSITHAEVMRERFPGREIYLIPQHHANYENARRPDRPVKVVGTIGGDSAVQWPHWAISEYLAKVGLEWRFLRSGHVTRRKQVVEFMKDLDVNFRFRPTWPRGDCRTLNVLSQTIAGSFGIPSVAYPEPAVMAEWKDECLVSESMWELMRLVTRLKDEKSLYDDMSKKSILKAEKYHISKIAELYRSLPGAAR